MEYANKQPETGYSLDQVLELTESENDVHYTPWEELHEEIDAWARRALAANGFGITD
jgi:hypothetical protein